MAKRKKLRKKQPRPTINTQGYPTLLDITDGIAQIEWDETRSGYPSFMTMLSPPQLLPLAVAEYPDHIFWHYCTQDSFFAISVKEQEQLERQGWEQIGKEKDAALEFAGMIAEGGLPDALMEQRVKEPPDERELALFPAHSQLARTAFIHTIGGKTGRTWIESTHLKTAMQYPVILTYMMPLVATETMSWADIVIGTHALVFMEHGVRLYSVDQLGEDGDRAWQEMHIPPNSAGDEELTIHQVNVHVQMNSILYERAAQAAQVLARNYWQLHEQTIANQPELPALPNIFEHATVVAMAPPLALRGVLAAYSNAQSGAKDWQNEPTPYYLYQEGANSARVEFHAPDLPPETIWQQIRSFSDLDGDILLALFAQWLVSAKDAVGYTWITAEHLLNYRGLLPRRYITADGQKRRYHYRYDDLNTMSACVARLRDTHVTVQQLEQQKPQGQRSRGRPSQNRFVVKSYLIQISEFIQQERLFRDETTRLPVAWHYSLGAAMIRFLETNQRVSSWLLCSLHYDPGKEAWEKRLSRYLIFQKSDQIVSIRYLFTELSFTINEGDPDKTRKRFEKALNRLAKDLEYFGWSYQDDLATLPPKKWIEHWLDKMVELRIPNRKLPTSPSRDSQPLQLKKGENSQ